MFTSAASENGTVWTNSLLFSFNWRLFASVLVTGVNLALVIKTIFKFKFLSFWQRENGANGPYSPFYTQLAFP